MKNKDGSYTGNKMHGVRLSPEINQKLEEGTMITGLNKSQFIRLAIVEKTEREIIKKGG